MMAAGILLALEHVSGLALALETSGNPGVEKATETCGTVPGPMRITFINPGISDPMDPTGGFWLSVSSFMREKKWGSASKKILNWIGSLIPDNNIAGSLVTQQIIDEATRRSASRNGKLKLFAIAGDPVTRASVQRVEGLRKTVSEYPNVELQPEMNWEFWPGPLIS